MTNLRSRSFGRPRPPFLPPVTMLLTLLFVGITLPDPANAAHERRKKDLIRYFHTGQGGLIDASGSTGGRMPLVKGPGVEPKWASAPVPLDLLIPVRYFKPPAKRPRR